MKQNRGEMRRDRIKEEEHLRDCIKQKKKDEKEEKISHLLVLRFLHRLVDVIENLSTAICCLLRFILLGCIV